MPAAAAVTGAEKVIEAGGKAYNQALRQYPRHYVWGAIAAGGLLGGALTAQTLGYCDFGYEFLDLEVPHCRKVHVFARTAGNSVGVHHRYAGRMHIKQIEQELVKAFGKEPQKEGAKPTYKLTLNELLDYPLNDTTPVWTLCKEESRIHKPNEKLPPCSLELTLSNL